MKYIAVSQNKDNVLRIFIWNKEAKAPHSYWTSLIMATEIASDLNKMDKANKKRMIADAKANK